MINFFRKKNKIEDKKKNKMTAKELSTIVNKYDILKQGRKRRHQPIEHTNETGISGITNNWDMLRAIAEMRNLYRNYSVAKSFLIQFKLHVIGKGNRMFCTTDNDDWNEQTQRWYNKVWSNECDARDDRNIHDLNALILNSVLREHDCVVYYDKNGIAGPKSAGKIWTWESDQIMDLTKADFEEHKKEIAKILKIDKYENIHQNSGVITDEFGIVSGYIVSCVRGLTETKWENATILPRGPAKLLKNTWRLNEHRGSSELLTAAASLIDNYEILQAELQGAKGAGKWVAAIKTDDSHFKSIGRVDSSDGDSEIDLTDDDVADFTNYKNLEELFEGAVEYMDPGDSLELKSNPRLGNQLEAFLNYQTIMAGASMGLPRFYSLMKADASFSATRAEMNLGAAIFGYWQSWLERYVLTWETKNALEFGIDNGIIKYIPNWEGMYEYDHPKQFPIMENAKASADKTFLEIGEITLRDSVGPEWRDKLRQRDKEIVYRQYLRDKANKKLQQNGGSNA